ncbi:MFS transporter [Rhodococcus fascians]|nr:MFS transporter [Rhodococcus fascians]MBY3998509.1 MFS transporter [Rhodococcus fascians]MBY4004497.1 MFS transporter [Rhodococcus fascians]MBY4009322.1 MFS transporter [Rhodococcus fascians]MBY4019704.1 MFS transporter [Rhodococcus fascians]
MSESNQVSSNLSRTAFDDRISLIRPRGLMLRVLTATSLAFAFDNADQAAMGIVAPAVRGSLNVGLNEVGLLISVTYFGLFLGAVTGGYISDRYGRLFLMRWSLTLASIGALSHLLVGGMSDFLLIRFLSALGMGGLYVSSLTYVAEMSQRKDRGYRIAITYFIGQIGAVILVTSARFIIPIDEDAWRYVIGIGGLGLIALVPMIGLPESPLWLFERGRLDEAEAALTRLERRSGIADRVGSASANSDSTNISLSQLREDETEKALTGKVKSRWVELFRGSLLLPTFVLIAVWVLYSSITMTYAGWLPTILGLQGFTSEDLLTISALAFWGAPLGALLSLFVVRRIPRFRLWAYIVVLAAICGVILSVAPSGGIIAVSAFIQYALFGLFAPILNALVADSYPTGVRARGTGLTFSAGRLTNVLAPLTLAVALGALGHVVVGWYLMTAWLLIGVAGAVMHQRMKVAQV